MVGPSGVDAPAEPAPQMVDDGFRVIAALSQGAHGRAARIIARMSDDELAALKRLYRQLATLVDLEVDARRADVP